MHVCVARFVGCPECLSSVKMSRRSTGKKSTAPLSKQDRRASVLASIGDSDGLRGAFQSGSGRSTPHGHSMVDTRTKKVLSTSEGTKAMLKEVAKGLKKYVEEGRREDGWMDPTSRTRKYGHDYDLMTEDDLKHYFMHTMQDVPPPSIRLMRAAPHKRLYKTGQKSDFDPLRKGKETRPASAPTATAEASFEDDWSSDDSFEERRANIQRDLEFLTHSVWAKEERRRNRGVVGASTPWKTWASSRTFGEMLEMNDPWYRAHHAQKIQNRNHPLPEQYLHAWEQYNAEKPMPARGLGTAALFDMTAEAIVAADVSAQKRRETHMGLRRKSSHAKTRPTHRTRKSNATKKKPVLAGPRPNSIDPIPEEHEPISSEQHEDHNDHMPGSDCDSDTTLASDTDHTRKSRTRSTSRSRSRSRSRLHWLGCLTCWQFSSTLWQWWGCHCGQIKNTN
eukprot:m.145964 g.145964  ORF g.145964 m.145964 type:complete len:449 (-) comp14146_c0_seq1:4108-5454(-)